MGRNTLRDYVNFYPGLQGLQRIREFPTMTYVVDLSDSVIHMYHTFFGKPLLDTHSAGIEFDEMAVALSFINNCKDILRHVFFDNVFFMRPNPVNMMTTSSQLAQKIAEVMIEHKLIHDYNTIDIQSMDAIIVFGNSVMAKFSPVMNDPNIREFYTWIDNPSEPQPVVIIETVGERVFFKLHKVEVEVMPFMGVGIN